MFHPDQTFWRPQHLDIGVTDLCNLECKYCYLTLDPGAPRGHMSTEVCNLVLDYTQRLVDFYPPTPEDPQPIKWNLFGGEPFVAFPVMQYLVNIARRHRWPVVIEVYTNGATATQEQVQWCKDNSVFPKRSVGGCPEACAITRPGAYLENYERETEFWDDRSLLRRVTVVPGTEQYIMQSLRYFYRKGYWGGIDFVTDDYANWSPEQIAELKNQITRLAEEYVRQFKAGCVMYNERIQITAQYLFQEPQRLNIGCGAGWGTQGITWDGYIVPCHRFLRESRNSPFCGGLLAELLAGDGPSFGSKFTDAVQSVSRCEETEECKQCSARLPCQHGCYHLSSVACDGDLKATPKVRCEVYRHYAKLAHWVHAELKPLDPIWYLCKAEPCRPIPEEA